MEVLSIRYLISIALELRSSRSFQYMSFISEYLVEELANLRFKKPLALDNPVPILWHDKSVYLMWPLAKFYVRSLTSHICTEASHISILKVFNPL
jgi:hypothetical protein